MSSATLCPVGFTESCTLEALLVEHPAPIVRFNRFYRFRWLFNSLGKYKYLMKFQIIMHINYISQQIQQMPIFLI